MLILHFFASIDYNKGRHSLSLSIHNKIYRDSTSSLAYGGFLLTWFTICCAMLHTHNWNIIGCWVLGTAYRIKNNSSTLLLISDR